MPRNVEIKARARLAEARRAVDWLSGSLVGSFRQDDTFFRVPRGRLKLRRLAHDRGELIFYERPDAAGPRGSDYTIMPTDDPDRWSDLLAESLGVIGAVRKRRTLYEIGQTRVHLDEVDGLGEFVELEVVLSDGQTEEDGVRIARELMGKLGIGEEDLVETAYVDLLMGPGANGGGSVISE